MLGGIRVTTDEMGLGGFCTASQSMPIATAAPTSQSGTVDPQGAGELRGAAQVPAGFRRPQIPRRHLLLSRHGGNAHKKTPGQESLRLLYTICTICTICTNSDPRIPIIEALHLLAITHAQISPSSNPIARPYPDSLSAYRDAFGRTPPTTGTPYRPHLRTSNNAANSSLQLLGSLIVFVLTVRLPAIEITPPHPRPRIYYPHSFLLNCQRSSSLPAKKDTTQPIPLTTTMAPNAIAHTIDVSIASTSDSPSRADQLASTTRYKSTCFSPHSKRSSLDGCHWEHPQPQHHPSIRLLPRPPAPLSLRRQHGHLNQSTLRIQFPYNSLLHAIVTA